MTMSPQSETDAKQLRAGKAHDLDEAEADSK